MLALAIKNRLAQWMGEKKWTQQRTASETGIHVTTIRRIQRQEADRVDKDTMAAICSAFGKTVSEFWYED